MYIFFRLSSKLDWRDRKVDTFSTTSQNIQYQQDLHAFFFSGVTCILVRRGMKHTVLQNGLEQFAARHKYKK